MLKPKMYVAIRQRDTKSASELPKVVGFGTPRSAERWAMDQAVPYVVHECRVMPAAKGRPKGTAAAAK